MIEFLLDYVWYDEKIVKQFWYGNEIVVENINKYNTAKHRIMQDMSVIMIQQLILTDLTHLNVSFYYT